MPPVLGRIQNSVVLALITAGIALLLALSPVARMMEEELGLSWLFTLRGPFPPPRDVAIISLDRQSSRRLGLPPQVRLWPRSLRATLIGELKKRGATAIAFDLTLETPTDQIQDGALTRAISAARSVVLVEALEREEVAVTDAQGNPAGHMAIVKAVPPIEPFAKAAAALAPFPLPKIAARTNQFWAFKEGAGDRLTLPAAALQVHGASVHAIWLSRLREADVPGLETLPPDNDLLSEPGSIQRASLAVRRAFLQDPGLIDRLPPLPTRLGDRERKLIDALDRLHTGPQHYYLNLYGPAGTISVIPFADLIEGKPIPDLTGRAVFVGVAERSSTNVDSFHTVFSTGDGIDISGVEIAATAFANLLDDVTLTMPKQGAVVGMLLGFGLAVGFVAYLLPGTWAVAATLFIAWGWLSIALRMFEQHHLWLPLAVPLLVQVPVALLGGLLWQYLSANLERRNVSRAIRYYLPEKAAADMTRRSADPGSARDLVFGTCVASDAARFTTLAEAMAPRDLAILLDSYFGTLFEQIQLHGGTVTDVVGDGITSVWAAQQPERDLRAQAVMAALDMTAAVRRFNRLRPDKPMPTRIGLHAGWIMVGNVGGQGHFAWSVVGDIPNTASRLEGLNKHLGTSVLASREVVGDLEEVLTRRLGHFRLFGKADALDIHEVVARRSEATASQLRLVALFETALEACEAGRMAEASDLLHRVLTEFPDDGPSRFYLERCAGHCAGTRILDDTAVVRLETK